jgi:hypothetical protein
MRGVLRDKRLNRKPRRRPRLSDDEYAQRAFEEEQRDFEDIRLYARYLLDAHKNKGYPMNEKVKKMNENMALYVPAYPTPEGAPSDWSRDEKTREFWRSGALYETRARVLRDLDAYKRLLARLRAQDPHVHRDVPYPLHGFP